MNDQMIPHPEFPISCGNPECCTGTLGENVTAHCTQESCKNAPAHPGNFHRYDDAAKSTSEMRGIEKIFERMFDEMHESIMNYGDIPYPTEYERESPENDDFISEFRDWFTMQVIKQFVN